MNLNKNIKIRKNLSARILAKASLQLGKLSANSACCYIYHQPKMPEDLKKLRKQ